jgi:transcriptional regulator with XRE-family HTH domain
MDVLIPSQIRGLRQRQGLTQASLANAAEMKQSRISAMETPGATNFNLETLVRLAAALKVGLIVKFVPFSELLDWENAFSQDEFNAVTIDEDRAFLNPSTNIVLMKTSNSMSK